MITASAPGGTGAPVMIRAAVPAVSTDLAAAAGGQLAQHAPLGHAILGAQRVAIHRRLGHIRQRRAGEDILGQHAPVGSARLSICSTPSGATCAAMMRWASSIGTIG